MVLPALKEALNERLSFITEEPLFSATAKVLNTTAYQNLEEGDLLEACETLVEQMVSSKPVFISLFS